MCMRLSLLLLNIMKVFLKIKRIFANRIINIYRKVVKKVKGVATKHYSGSLTRVFSIWVIYIWYTYGLYGVTWPCIVATQSFLISIDGVSSAIGYYLTLYFEGKDLFLYISLKIASTGKKLKWIEHIQWIVKTYLSYYNCNPITNQNDA